MRAQRWIPIVFAELKDRVVGHCSCIPQRRGVGRGLVRRGVDGEERLRPQGLRPKRAMVLFSHISNG